MMPGHRSMLICVLPALSILGCAPDNSCPEWNKKCAKECGRCVVVEQYNCAGRNDAGELNRVEFKRFELCDQVIEEWSMAPRCKWANSVTKCDWPTEDCRIQYMHGDCPYP